MLLAGAATVSGLGPVLWVTAGPAWAFTAPVKIDERAGGGDTFEFAPTAVQVDVDDKVLWTNKSQTRHTVTSSAGNSQFDSGGIPPGGQWERRFTVAGTYTYHCEIHPDMIGRIEVGEPVTTTSTAPPPTTTTAPPPTTTTAPPTTTTTEAPTTTTSAPRPAAGAPAQPLPPVPASAPARPPTPATSSTTTAPPTTTTTAAPPTTVTSAPPVVPGEGEAAPPGPAPEAPPSTDAAPPPDKADDEAALARRNSGDGADAATVAMVSALVGVGLFAAWTLIRVRPGRI